MSTTSSNPSNGKEPEHQIGTSKPQLYAKLGFAALVVFGMVGNCTGHRDASMVVFVVTAIAWVIIRIMTEALDAWHRLSAPPSPPAPPGPRPGSPTSNPPPAVLA